MAIRVLLADDHRLILDALERTFEEVAGIEIVATARDGRQVVPLIARSGKTPKRQTRLREPVRSAYSEQNRGARKLKTSSRAPTTYEASR